MPITCKGEIFEPSNAILVLAKGANQELTDSYIEELKKNYSYDFSRDISILIMSDLFSKKFIGKKGFLGQIVKIDSNGKLLGYFETVYDAVIDSIHHNKKRYIFEYYLKESEFQKPYMFFGTQIDLTYNNYINNQLNKTINFCYNTYFEKRKYIRDYYEYMRLQSKISFEEYKLRKIKYDCLQLGSTIQITFNNIKRNPCIQRDTEPCLDYQEKLNKLIKRYSLNKSSAFINVKKISNYCHVSGIYILCLSNIKACYIEYEERCIMTSIIRLFLEPESIFYGTYTPDDIDQILILPLDKTMDMAKSIKTDCANILGYRICLNTHFDQNASKHLNKLKLWRIVKDSQKYTRYLISINKGDSNHC